MRSRLAVLACGCSGLLAACPTRAGGPGGGGTTGARSITGGSSSGTSDGASSGTSGGASSGGGASGTAGGSGGAVDGGLDGGVQHYLYAFLPSEIVVYDLDHAFAEVKTVAIPDAGTFRGAVATAATGTLYLSYGSFGGPGGELSAYDLVTDQLLWTRVYPFGIDSLSLTPGGRTIFMPTGWSSPGGAWEILDAGSGDPEGVIDTAGTGPHNTIVSLDGSKVALGPGYSDYLYVADAKTATVLASVGPVASGVRPFTINGKATLVFMTTTGYLGFYVGDMATGRILFQVPVPGFTSSAASTCHGISLSPDESELYLIDYGNDYVHVFDPTGLPAGPPVDVADIPLQTPMTDEGWLLHTRDGRYVIVGDCGDVIDTSTRTVVGHLPALLGTRIFTEVDFQNGAVSFAPQSRNQGGYVQ